jgi:hypothetical protein
MRKRNLLVLIILLICSLVYFSCRKEISKQRGQEEVSSAASNANAETPHFNLEIILRGEGNAFGLIKFRQAVDPAKIITLDVWVRDLGANHAYLLQRAVDPINVVDGDCTSTSWLTLGKGLTPQSIMTDANGEGRENLWRDITAVPTGSTFDIHFRVIDAVTMAVVLTSDCYQYTVR